MQIHLSKILLAIFSILGLLSLPYLIQQSYLSYTQDQKNYSELEEWEEESKLQRIGEIMQEEFKKTKDPTTNTVPRERLLEARKIIAQKQSSGNKSAIPNLNWEERGPNNIGGRTRAILIDANDPTHATVWAGGAGGGLWKSTNFFAEDPQWQQVGDFFDNLAITCITQDPQNPDHIYFGTGEGWYNVDATRGLGIWKSTDGGATFNQMPSTNNNSIFHYIQDIIIDKNQNLYAATRSGGIQKLSNNSNNWIKVVGEDTGTSNNDKAADLEISSTGDVYATIGIFSEGSVWKSPSGSTVGDLGTWEEITPETGFRRLELSIAPSNPNRLYVLMQDAQGNVGAVYRSDDAGQVWTKVTTPPSSFTRGQAWYNLISAVDPNEPDAIYIGGVDAYASINAGSSWTKITSWTTRQGYYSNTVSGAVHADQHAIVFFPGESTKAIWGTDGGLYYTEDLDYNYSSKPNFYNKNYGYNVTQFYSVAMHPDTGSDYFLAGSQDNGTQRFTTNGMNQTIAVTGGDGGFCHIDQNNPNYQFSAYTRNALNRSTNGGQSFSSGIYNNQGSFINPTDYDNETYHLYASHSHGSYLRWNNARTSRAYDIVEMDNITRRSTAILCDPTTSNRLWLGWYGGVGFVDNADTNTPISTALTLPDDFPATTYVSSIDVDLTDPDHIIVSASNYGMPSVWDIKNATTSNPIWSKLDNGTSLPDMPVRWAIFNPTNSNQALIATEMGVWSTSLLDGENTEWAPSNNGLANVRVDMLQYRSSDNMIVASTHGRGIFTTKLTELPQVNFTERTSTVSERGTNAGGNCNESYTDIQLPITISEAPVSPIEIEILLKNTTSASPNRDFDLQNSITKVTFSPNDNLTQHATIRLLDDATEELDEIIDLQLSISENSGGMQRGSNFSHTIHIMDDEPVPTAPNLEVKTFYIEDFSNEFDSNIQTYHFTGQHNWIYSTQGPQMNPSQKITSPTSSNGFAIFDSDGISIGDYAEDAFLQLAPINCMAYKDIQLQFYQQHCRLTEATTVEVSTDGVTYHAFPINEQMSYNECTPTQDLQTLDIGSIADHQEFVYIRFRYQGSMDFWWQIDDIALLGKPSVFPETEVNQSRTAYVGALETAHFYSDKGQIIASITELAGNEMGCVALMIDRAGDGRQSANYLQGGSASISDKVYNITAENESDYELILYYTDNELAIWDNNAALTVLQSSVNLAHATAHNVELQPIQLITSNYYSDQNFTTFKGSFNKNGNFGLTDANQVTQPLPIALLSFTGEVVKDYIQLEWRTASELNADHFIVEHSTDGINFNFFLQTTAMGTSRESNTYQVQDWQPLAGNNYYRLTEVDIYGKAGKPFIINVDFHTSTALSISPNPIEDQILKIQLTTAVTENVRIEVFNTLGQSIYVTEQFVPIGSQNLELRLPNLSTGIYLMHVKGKSLDNTLQFLIK